MEIRNSSDISFLAEGPKDPMLLFKDWLQQAIDCGHKNPRALSLATSLKNGEVNNRHVMLRRIESDGLVIVTDRRSMKSAELAENSQAAVAFLWEYEKDGKLISRQVRMKVGVREMAPDEYEGIYNAEPLYCKLRSHVCHQGQPADWQQLKLRHDSLKQQFEDGENQLQMPSHYVGYKLTPILYDFYHANEFQIADRIGYKKVSDGSGQNTSDECWSQFKVTA